MNPRRTPFAIVFWATFGAAMLPDGAQGYPWIQQDRWMVLGPLRNSAGCDGDFGTNPVIPHDLAEECPAPFEDWSDVELFREGAARLWTPLAGLAPAADVLDLNAVSILLGVDPDAAGEVEDVLALAVIYATNTTGNAVMARLCSSSDDSIAIFLNDGVVLQKSACRSMGEGCDDTTPVVLSAGENKILVVLWQGKGTWRFKLGLLDAEGRPIDDTTDPRIRLSIYPLDCGGQGVRRWCAFDAKPPGTMADLAVDGARSDLDHTVLDLTIHGFWVQTIVGPDSNLYRKIQIPGLGSIDMSQTGAPDLPVIRPKLAIGTTASAAGLGQATGTRVHSFENVLVWPQPIEATEVEPEQFVRDDDIYGSSGFWPLGDGIESVPVKTVGSIPSCNATLYPIKWDPNARVLLVPERWTCSIMHVGNRLEALAITRDSYQLAGWLYANWGTARQVFKPNLVSFEGQFLFIYPPHYETLLLPLVNQKKARGFYVTERTTDTVGDSCYRIRQAIKAWSDKIPAGTDKYCLLVGDTDIIPFCKTPEDKWTDDLYASTNGDDLDEEIFLGRMSIKVDYVGDVKSQVAKIIAYEDNPQTCCYEKVLLVAHDEYAPRWFTANQESVRTATYSVPPTFSTQYGYQPGVNNASVSAAINAGLGLVAYRGHGTAVEWDEWNIPDEDYTIDDVDALTNGPRVPVIWNIACSTHDATAKRCLGVHWMSNPKGGGVSSYGATARSVNEPNDELNLQLFKAVYDLDLVIQSHAIKYAEAQMASLTDPKNAWYYYLLGDPQMAIRRRNPKSFKIVKPEFLSTKPPCDLEIRVSDSLGRPADVLVAAWKGAPMPGLPDEVFANRYTDAEGVVRIPITLSTPGRLTFTIRDQAGDTFVDTIPVVGENIGWRRCDVSGDGSIDITDAISSLGYQFLGEREPDCMAAADCNGEGGLNIADPIFLLSYLFLGSQKPPGAFPGCDEVFALCSYPSPASCE